MKKIKPLEHRDLCADDIKQDDKFLLSFTSIGDFHLLHVERVTWNKQKQVVEYCDRLRPKMLLDLKGALNGKDEFTIDEFNALCRHYPLTESDLAIEGKIADLTAKFKVSADTALLIVMGENK